MMGWACINNTTVAQMFANKKDGLCESLVLVNDQYMCTEHVVKPSSYVKHLH